MYLFGSGTTNFYFLFTIITKLPEIPKIYFHQNKKAHNGILIPPNNSIFSGLITFLNPNATQFGLMVLDSSSFDPLNQRNWQVANSVITLS